MTKNPKPNDLPTSIEDLPAVTRPLIIDGYLDRQAVIDRIVDQTSLTIDPSGGHFSHYELATFLRSVDDDEQRNPRTIINERQKYDIIVGLGDQYGFETRPDQDALIKSQLVHILVTLATGDTPDQFELPSDPDRDADRHQNVPVLGD